MSVKSTPEDVDKKAKSKNPNISLVVETYIDRTTPCKWVDSVWGEFTKAPTEVMRGRCFHPDHVREITAAKQDQINAKREATNLERFGSKCPLNTQEFLDKKNKTMLERYGVLHPIQNQDIRKQIESTNLQKYGTKSPLESRLVLDKISDTNLERYGHESILKSTEVRNKIKSTNLQKYGVENLFFSKDVQNQIQETNLQKYGFRASFQNEEVKAKITRTNLQRYGVGNPSKNKKVQEKIRQTSLRKYGFTSPTQHPDTQTKIFNTKQANGSYKTSIPEQELLAFCKSLDPDVRSTMAYLDDKSFQIDVYSTAHNICIEYNGLFWHSEGNKTHYALKHLEKTQACEKQGRRLLHIWGHEWENRQEQVKDYIKSAFGLFERRTQARKCKVREISDKRKVKDFLDANHLLGACSYVKAIGMYQNDELLGVALLGRHHRTNVLNVAKRFAFLRGVQVVGGVSKLSTHLLKMCPEDYMITWGEIRLGVESSYNKAGWVLEQESRPDYFYFDEKTGKVVSKQSVKHLTKKKTGLSEREHTKLMKWHRVYDCGKRRFKFSKDEPF